MVFFVNVVQKKAFQDRWHRFIQVRCTSCHPTYRVKSLKGIKLYRDSSMNTRCYLTSRFLLMFEVQMTDSKHHSQC